MALTSQHTHDRLLDMLTTGLGAVGPYLHDPTVTEIMLNPDGQVWIERLGQACENTGICMLAQDADRVIRLVAKHVQSPCTEEQPSLSAELPETGARFQAHIPPIVAAPSFTIRRHALQVFTLDDYVRQGVCTQEQANVLRWAILERINIIVSGGTSTGKTTLLNALCAVMEHLGQRLVTIEDRRELQCVVPNRYQMYTREGVRSMRDLATDAMRLRPDRVILGEVRGIEVIDVFDVWSSGHPGGACTVHGDTPRKGLRRMESFMRRTRIPRIVAREVIAEAEPLVVQLHVREHRRCITTILRVDEHLHRGDYQFHVLPAVGPA